MNEHYTTLFVWNIWDRTRRTATICLQSYTPFLMRSLHFVSLFIVISCLSLNRCLGRYAFRSVL
mgnify:CR=1 FL=1